MGNSFFSEERQRDKVIGQKLKQEHQKSKSVLKVLLLGTGDSGKSTIFKQARRLGGKTTEEAEYQSFAQPIRENIIVQAKVFVAAIDRYGESLKITLTDAESECKAVIEKQEFNDSVTSVPQSFANAVLALWSNPKFKPVLKHRGEFNLLECVEYFFQQDILNRICSEGAEFKPNFEDLLHARNRTTGIVEALVLWNRAKFVIYDVGGQRAERKKWIACFANVHTILFVVAISEYDQKLFEDEKVRRIDEALQLWNDLVNRDDFREVGFLLFLNKWDVFQAKLRDIPFKVASGPLKRNEDYEGAEPLDFENGSEEQMKKIKACGDHVKARFMSAVNSEKRFGTINYHYTVAIDSSTFDRIFEQCVEQILGLSLLNKGMS